MSSGATEKEVLLSDERAGIHFSGNKEPSGWYVLYKLIVGVYNLTESQKQYLQVTAACER